MKKMSEDGHADVASALRKCKTIMEDASDIHTKLAMMGTMILYQVGGQINLQLLHTWIV